MAFDRDEYWATKGKKKGRLCLRIVGCRTCGATHSVTWRKDERGQLQHEGCPGPRPLTPRETLEAEMKKAGLEVS